MRRRVVITGMGAVTPIGNNVKDTWVNLSKGKSGVGPITIFDASSFPTKIAGEIKNFDFKNGPLRIIISKCLAATAISRWKP